MASSTLYLVAFLAVLSIVAAEELYSDEFDHINPHDILENDEVRNQYYNCIMDRGPCTTPDMKYFKEVAAEAFVTKCRRCTEVQKQNIEKVIIWYTENRPDEWANVVQKLLEDAKKLNITPV